MLQFSIFIIILVFGSYSFLGDGFSGAKCGPVVNKIQYDKVTGYIKKSIDEGVILIQN